MVKCSLMDLEAIAMKLPKLQHYWSLTIRLFCVISTTLVAEELPLRRDAVALLYNCGRIFLYYHFSLVISYHSVWLVLELSAGIHALARRI